MQNFSKKKLKEFAIYAALFAFAATSIFITLGILFILCSQAFVFFTKVSPVGFFFGTQWTPLFEPQHFGVLPLLGGTVLIALTSIVIALPIGLGIAVYLSQFASNKVKKYFKPVLELLAGIPSVVYGYFALVTISPIIQGIFPSSNVFNALSASIVVAIMILPMIASISDDALSSLPKSLAESGHALGATPFEVITSVLIPSASSGIIAAVILGISRAIGETMAVTLAAGATPNLTANPLESVQTMTAYIVQVSLGDVEYGSIQYDSIFAVALVLFLLTLVMNLCSNLILRKLKARFQ